MRITYGAVAMPSMFLEVQPSERASFVGMVIVAVTVVSKLIDEDARENVTKFCDPQQYR